MNPSPYGYPPAQPQKKKGMSTVLVVLLVLGGLFVVAAVIVGVVAVRFARSVSSSPIGVETNRAMDAPGAKGLCAVGCCSAQIVDTATMPELTSLYAKDPRRPDQPQDVPLVVECGATLSPPKCDDVRTQYLSVVKTAKTPFRVFVTTIESKVVCNQKYSETGAPL